MFRNPGAPKVFSPRCFPRKATTAVFPRSVDRVTRENRALLVDHAIMNKFFGFDVRSRMTHFFTFFHKGAELRALHLT